MTRALLVLLLALAASAAGSAQPPPEVWLHDLTGENGGYVGCHVTDGAATYRHTTDAGDHLQLTIRSYDNNTLVHTVRVPGASASEVTVLPGSTRTLALQLDEPGSYPIVCDGARDQLSGQIIARPQQADGEDTPALPLAMILAALAALTIFRRTR